MTTRRHSWQPPTEQNTIARLAKAAREVGFEPSDIDNLHPARGIAWLLVAWLLIIAALAMILMPAAYAQPRALAMIGALHSRDTTNCEVDAPPPVAPAHNVKRDLGAPIPPAPPPAGPFYETTDLESFTPGLGLAFDLTPSVMAAAGGWRTSQKNWAAFGLVDWRPLRVGDFSAGLFGGVSGGYCKFENRLGPLGGLTARLDIERVAVHLLFVPSVASEKNAAALGIALSVGF